MDYELKNISIEDLDDLYELNQKIFKNEILYEREYINRFCKLGQGYIMKENNNLIGYILYGLTYHKTGRYFTIISIGILESYRGKGYGKHLLATITNKYPEKDIILHVRVTNKIAQRLYKSLGFVISDIEKDYYHQLNDDAYCMIRKGIIN
jgi:ribosomal-protein-alanine N-acetyltransferase